MALKNNYKFRLSGTLTTSGTSVSIGNDLWTNSAVSLAAGTSICMTDRTGKNREFMTVSATGGTLTISARGLDEDSSADSSLKKEWRKGTLVFVTILSHQLADLTGDNSFDGDITVADTKKVKFVDANTYIYKDGSNDLVFKDPNSSEISLSSLSSLSGSNDKFKISSNDTTEDFAVNKLTGGDGITITETTDGGDESLDFDIDTTDTNVFVTSAATSKIPKTDGTNGYLREFINSNSDGLATESEPGLLPEIATLAEVLAGTANKFGDAEDNLAAFGSLINVVTGTRTSGEGTGTESIAHGCSRTPIFVLALFDASTTTGIGFYGDSAQSSIQIQNSGHSREEKLISNNSGYEATVTGLDATNLDVTRSGGTNTTSYTLVFIG